MRMTLTESKRPRRGRPDRMDAVGAVRVATRSGCQGCQDAASALYESRPTATTLNSERIPTTARRDLDASF
jgi:hypothetical protein